MRKYIGPFLFLYLNGQMSKEGNRKPNPACRIWHYILKSEKPNLQKWAVSEDFCLPTRFCCRRWVRGEYATIKRARRRILRCSTAVTQIRIQFREQKRDIVAVMRDEVVANVKRRVTKQ